MVLVSDCKAQKDQHNSLSLPPELWEHHQKIPTDCRHQEHAEDKEVVSEEKKTPGKPLANVLSGFIHIYLYLPIEIDR